MTRKEELLVDINHEIKKLENRISDYEWEGNFSYADDLRDSLEQMLIQREAGDLYIPRF